MKYRFKTRPFRHQKRATLEIVRHGNYALFMDPRTGKTKTIVDAVGIQALQGKIERVVVLTTIDGCAVWQDEIAQHFPYSAAIRTIGEDVVRIGNCPPLVKFYLLNYDMYRSRRRDHRHWAYPVAQAIEAWGPDLVVLDESHRVKRAGGVTSQLAWRSVRRMRKARGDGKPFVVLATGTPNAKGWIDIFAQFRVMDDSIFGTAKSSFEDRHVVYGQGSRKYSIIAYKRVPEIKRKIRKHAFVISEEKAFPGMPPQLWQNLPVVLPPEARRIYEDMAEELVADFDGGSIEAANAGARRIRLLQITGGFTTDGQQIHGAKLEVFESAAREDAERGERCVVYARFLPEVRAISETLERLKVPHHSITGKTSRADRRRAREDLLGGAVSTLVFQVATGSEAIDLSAAHEILFYSLPDGWKDYWQATRRIRGPKQTHATRYRHIVARGTLDRSVLTTLQERGDMHAELMRSPRAFLFGV